ncbi:MAG: tRNA (adenosine(37)-N6)-dimethylallyltransferase MiaA [Bdellovibrionia bacterium]
MSTAFSSPAKKTSSVHPTIGILSGPMATGKSSLALHLTSLLPSLEIINADSLLVYRGLDIGTAKPTPSELKQVRHHLVDIVDPDQSFTAGEFYRRAQEAICEIQERGKQPLIVGGTGFYLKSLIFGLWKAPPSDPALRQQLENNSNELLHQELLRIDPASAQRIGKADRYRLIRALEIYRLSGKSPSELEQETHREPDPRFRLWILDRTTDEMEIRIAKRTQMMVDQGLINEYQNQIAQFPSSRALGAIGYAQVRDFLAGIPPSGRKPRPGIQGLIDEIQLATRQLLKQQRTWFKNQSRQIPQSRWFLLDQQLPELLNEAICLYKKESQKKKPNE